MNISARTHSSSYLKQLYYKSGSNMFRRVYIFSIITRTGRADQFIISTTHCQFSVFIQFISMVFIRQTGANTSQSLFLLSNVTLGNINDLCKSCIDAFVDNGYNVEATKSIKLNIKQPPSCLATWFLGLVCVTFISLCAVIGLFFIRSLSKKNYDKFITIFVAVGVGSLIASSTLHLIPQGLRIADTTNFDFIYVQLFVIIGMYTFFFSDKLLKIILESKKTADKAAIEVKLREENNAGNVSKPLVHDGDLSMSFCNSGEAVKGRSGIESMCDVDMSRQAHGICVHDHKIDFNRNQDSAVKTVAWMIIFGDGLHNFIDGISIGAAFSESLMSGFSVSLAVFAEEFPHELGDVAILLSAGLSMRQALLYNLLSAVTCFFGFAIGVVLGSVESFLRYVFGFSGGMFLYIALSCMMPEMRHTMEEALVVGHSEALQVLLLQTLGLVGGTMTMFLFSRYGHLIDLSDLNRFFT